MKEYYSNKKILEKNAEYNIILGERSNGKSYCIKMEQCLKKAIKQEKCTFIIIRRLSEDIKSGFIEEYFADMPISKLTKGKYNKIVGYRDGIYLAKEDEEENKIIKGLQIGKAMALSNDERYKSRLYPDITDIVFEEFVTNKLYLRDEVNRFMNLVSTILRRRRGKAWLIANTISRICPYFNEWGLRGIPTMKQGQIDLYNIKRNNNEVVKIAVEYCGNTGEEKSGMFFGRFEKSIDGGAWECSEYPKLPEGDICYHYTLGFKYNDFGFIISLCSLDNDLFLYIKPARKVKDNFVFPSRILTNDFSISRLISNSLNLDVPVECLISRLFRQGKVCYSHNLCGEDFNSCLLNSKIIL